MQSRMRFPIWSAKQVDFNKAKVDILTKKALTQVNKSRSILNTPLRSPGAKLIEVSTVSLFTQVNGANFETLILGGRFHSSSWRFLLHEDAINGHNEIVKELLNAGYSYESVYR